VSVAAKSGIAEAAVADKPNRDSTIYEIWFYDNVQVVQSEQTLATGNTITVFSSMRDNPEKPATTRASDTPQAQGEAATKPGGAPSQDTSTKAPAPTTAAPTAPATSQPAEATTQPSDQAPVIVY